MLKSDLSASVKALIFTVTVSEFLNLFQAQTEIFFFTFENLIENLFQSFRYIFERFALVLCCIMFVSALFNF